jgi:hypothetical protein
VTNARVITMSKITFREVAKQLHNHVGGYEAVMACPLTVMPVREYKNKQVNKLIS